MERETARIVEEGSGLSDPISLTLPSSPEYVLLARLVMGQAGRLAGLEPDEVYDLKLAVTEAVTNVIRHASVESYEIEYRVLPLGVEVSVTDPARPRIGWESKGNTLPGVSRTMRLNLRWTLIYSSPCT
jgi:hypothetical protein